MAELRRTWAEIDREALTGNYDAICAISGCEVWPVVKANAYGHGAIEVARLMQSRGAKNFAVSNLREAEELLQAGIEGELLILGYTPAAEAVALAESGICQCVYSLEYAELLNEAARGAGVRIKAHLKLDTGMARLGFDCRNDDLPGLRSAARALKLSNLDFTGVFTHFAVADGCGAEDAAFTAGQYDRFYRAVELLEAEGYSFAQKHCSNSAAMFTLPDARTDAIRAGIILYGLAPSGEVPLPPAFKPAMSLYSVVSMVKELRPEESVSYGRTYKADAPRWIATVTAGYADGYPRLLSNRGYVLIHGKKAPILGRVCMDQLCVDVSHIPEVAMGDQVTLFGPGLPVEKVAEWAGTINYEIVCGIAERVPRIYSPLDE